MFITFEGIEGCGKTTQVKRISKWFSDNNIPFIVTLEPGGTETGKKIREMLLSSRNNNIFPLTELFLYAADRAQHVKEIIKPALDEGKWVICDRYYDATTAYQGSGRKQKMELIEVLNNSATYGIRPDVTFLLDCPVEIGIERALTRNEIMAQKDQDRFDREKIEFHKDVREGYLELARKEKKRFAFIDATLAEDLVEEEILNVLRPLIESMGHRFK